MVTSDNLDAPHNFAKDVHKALRSWHKQHGGSVLDHLLLAHQLQMRPGTASARLISNQILINGLDLLKQVNIEAFNLLQSRFINKETAREIAFRQNVGEDVIYQRQRAAIQQLARTIWEQEKALRQQQAQRILARLEPMTYTKLFGMADKVAEVRTRVEMENPPWILTLEGMGGIGKTSLANALARELAYSTRFREIAWISARRCLFRLPGNIEALPACPCLTISEMVDRLIEQFGLLNLRRQSDGEKLVGVKDYLKSQPCLIILDNLETLADYRAFVAQLRELVNPTKFLITTRYSLRGEGGVYILQLEGLSRADTLDLIRYEAETQGLDDLAQAPDEILEPIYALTGGNPLATKLIVGQVHTFSLPVILKRLRSVEPRPVNELLEFIYADAWDLLDTKQRRVMQAMLLTPEEGGHIEHIAAASDLTLSETSACLHRLATLSLINVSGGLEERHYTIHQLTHTFVTQQSSVE